MPGTSNSTPDRLSTVAELLKEELLCGTEAVKAVAHLRETLRAHPSGEGVTEDVTALESALQRIQKCAQRTDAFLQQAGADSLADVVGSLPPSPMREGVNRLAIRAAQQQRALRTALASAKAMLEKSGHFIAFHVNLLTQTTASNTYAPPGASEGAVRSGRRMFDANA